MAHPVQDPRTAESTLAHIADVRSRMPRIEAAGVFRACGDAMSETGRSDLADVYWSEMLVLWEEATADAENTDNWDEVSGLERMVFAK